MHHHHHGGNGMMMYHSIFTISLKLLTVFIIVKLLAIAAANGGGGRGVPIGGGWNGGAGGWAQQQQLQQMYNPNVNVNHNPAGSVGVVTQSTTGAAAGASTGNQVVGPVQPLASVGQPTGGYATLAASNARPHYVPPAGGLFRFGGLRFPMHRRPMMPPMGPPIQHHNMGLETQLVETHSHVLVHPDGTQSKMPAVATQAKANAPVAAAASNVVPVVTNQTPKANQPAASTAENSGSATAQQVAQRRSSLAFKDQRHYDDWQLHLNPGTRSL